MSLKRITKIFENPDYRDWGYGKSVVLNLYVGDYNKPLNGFLEIYQFFDKELNKWTNDEKEIQWIPIKGSIEYLKQIYHLLNQCLIQLESNQSINNLNRTWGEVERLLNNSQSLYLRDFEETQFLIDVHAKAPELVNGIADYFQNKNSTVFQSNDLKRITGALLAYEFRTQDLSSLLKRKSADRRSVNKLRDELYRVLSDLERKKIEFTDDLEKEFDKKQVELETTKQELIENIRGFEEKSKAEYLKLIETTTQKFEEQERTYQELLMLKKPAEYWDQRAEELKKSSKTWLWLAAGTSVLGFILFIVLAFSLSIEHVQSQITNPAISIRWSLLSLLAIALVVFLVRTFTKLTMSSYHLYRDAQERKQLTYLYLSLKHETNIPDADRHLILQSLFSRSDTGLLKEDSGPTMPISSLDKLNQH